MRRSLLAVAVAGLLPFAVAACGDDDDDDTPDVTDVVPGDTGETVPADTAVTETTG